MEMNSNGNPGKSKICAVEKNGKWMEYYVSSESGRNYEELGFPGKSIICAVQKDEEKQRLIEKYVLSKSGIKYEELGSELEISKICAVQNSQLEIKGSYFEASYIVFKSCLYRIGGCYRDEVYGGEKTSNKSVDKLDLKNMDLGWVKVAEMNCGRVNPYTVILGGKLYVVGGLTIKPEEETAILMEVFESDEFGWETISNPPLPNPNVYYHEYVYDNKCDESIYVKREWKLDNRYLKRVFDKVIAGGVERETETDDAFIFVIVAGFDETYYYYTYEVKAKIWMPYTKFTSKNLSDKDFLYSGISIQPTVVSGQLMLFLGYPEMLYVMDLEKGNLCTIDLVKRSVIDKDEDRLHCGGLPPYLVMIEKKKFCVFWGVVGPKCKETGKVYSILKGCIFTLQRKPKRNTFRIKKISTWSSLLPDLTTHKLEAVCLVDFIPDLSNSNSKVLL